MSWDELKWVKVSWGELRWVEVSWGELRWVEVSWGELRWGELHVLSVFIFLCFFFICPILFYLVFLHYKSILVLSSRIRSKIILITALVPLFVPLLPSLSHSIPLHPFPSLSSSLFLPLHPSPFLFIPFPPSPSLSFPLSFPLRPSQRHGAISSDLILPSTYRLMDGR